MPDTARKRNEATILHCDKNLFFAHRANIADYPYSSITVKQEYCYCIAEGLRPTCLRFAGFYRPTGSDQKDDLEVIIDDCALLKGFREHSRSSDID